MQTGFSEFTDSQWQFIDKMIAAMELTTKESVSTV
jgi:hypothetical protein